MPTDFAEVVQNPAAASHDAQATETPLSKPALASVVKLSSLLGIDSSGEFSSDPVELDDVSDGETDLSDEIVAKETYVPEWQTYTVQNGDTFAVMAERSLGLGYSEVMNLLKIVPNKKVLTNLRVGRNIDYMLDEHGQLLALKVMKNSRDGYLLERNNAESEFEYSDVKRASQATQRLFAGTLEGSFGVSAQSTGLSSAEVAELTKILSKKVNFQRDARQGDRFQVLVESDMIDGKPLDSRILAAHYEGTRADITVLRHNDHFYTPEGKGLDTAFERYPFRGHYRISSPYNLKRRHPVTGRISPHLGTDFAAPVGTPVLATGDGRVIKVGNHPAAGRYIVIAHDNGYKTRYLHLSKPLVKKGERVKMDERIALSGNTGRSTGAHIHYEVMVNNRQVDAMRVKLPDGHLLSGKELAVFKKKSKQLIAKLDTADNARAVASTQKHDHDNES
ncbi:peptidoglycan DD-metalloendopeptidase family protein [Phytohalomonas tamaricis]|uniref:peptidoglycan DD-metalloendopeptidase family protein n=1 Tax=Phytohalomonas tamaricis TaxID=2081032 RepID=UPI002948BFD2|nr:peptidoglycan DD-metalloendopeptidase family protein [Phytohalomonas tamaricis]